jgi:hypothetical protein
VIEWLREENRVLKQQLGGKRLRLTDAQRRRLAAKGKLLGYKALSEVVTLFEREVAACASCALGKLGDGG